jgi:vacuolar-type H+-ATPase subunit H
MEQSTLQEILAVEKEIREQIDAEREKAGQWLEDARREIETSHRSEMARLKEMAAQRDAATQQCARDKAAEILRHAQEAIAAAKDLRDEDLTRRIARCIAAINPGAASAR